MCTPLSVSLATGLKHYDVMVHAYISVWWIVVISDEDAINPVDLGQNQ